MIEAPGADPGASFSSWGRGIPRRRPAEGRSRFHRRSAAYGRGRPFGPESPKGFGSYRDSGATPRSPNHRVGAGSTGDPRPVAAAGPLGPESPLPAACLSADRAGRRDSAPTAIPGATLRSPNHKVGAGSTRDPRRRRGRPVRAGVAEGIRLLPRFRGHAAISQPQGRSRLHRRSAPAARPAPSGRGRRRDSAPTAIPGSRRDLPTTRVGAGCTGDPRRRRGNPAPLARPALRAGIAEGFGLFAGLTL